MAEAHEGLWGVINFPWLHMSRSQGLKTNFLGMVEYWFGEKSELVSRSARCRTQTWNERRQTAGKQQN